MSDKNSPQDLNAEDLDMAVGGALEVKKTDLSSREQKIKVQQKGEEKHKAIIIDRKE